MKNKRSNQSLTFKETNVLDVRVVNIDTSQPCTITFVLSGKKIKNTIFI